MYICSAQWSPHGVEILPDDYHQVQLLERASSSRAPIPRLCRISPTVFALLGHDFDRSATWEVAATHGHPSLQQVERSDKPAEECQIVSACLPCDEESSRRFLYANHVAVLLRKTKSELGKAERFVDSFICVQSCLVIRFSLELFDQCARKQGAVRGRLLIVYVC